mgnify:FL=1|tara:strand:+ start:1717 stop:2400 length:684 start_codon:yes stop_codon:yes gene_type:complete
MEPGELEQFQYKFKLKTKTIKGDKLTLYIEVYKGGYRLPDGKKIHYRDFEFLKLYLHSNPKNEQQLYENHWAKNKANEVLEKRKQEAKNGKYVSPRKNLKPISETESNILDKQNTLSFDNLNLIRESILRINPKDRLGSMNKLLQEVEIYISKLGDNKTLNIKKGDIVKANKKYPSRKYNQWYGEKFKVIDIKPHKTLGIGYRIASIDDVFKDLSPFYVKRESIIKV